MENNKHKLPTLYKRDKTGKKVLSYEVEIKAIKPDGALFATTAEITKTTGFLDGKKQQHFDYIDRGKQNRSVWEQAISVAESGWRSKLDEGYKSIEDLGIDITQFEPESKLVDKNRKPVTLKDILLRDLPKDRTDASGVLKPMKCTATNDTKTNALIPRVLKKIKYPCDVQTKLDGVRCFICHDGNRWRATSSSGKSYDVAARYILAELEELKISTSLILDGELYRHGYDLQDLSGWARKQTPIEEHKLFEFHMFDLPLDKAHSMNNSWEIREFELRSLFELIPNEFKIKFVESHRVDNIEQVIELHDIFVGLGYEGAIIRNDIGVYEYGIRSSNIFKMKAFQDAEFKIIGAELGKRGTFDMVFCMETKEGKPFKAKPNGDDAQKEKYWDELDNIIGKIGTVRFLTYSKDLIPQGNPVFKCVRDYD